MLHQALATRPLKDRRLIILFFDLSSMQPDEIDRATTAAQNYVDKQMVPADLVSVVSLGSTLQREPGLHLRPGAAEEGAAGLQSGRRRGLRRRQHRHDRGHIRDRRILHGGRHRVQHLQHRPPSAGPALDRGQAGHDRREEVADLFLQRHGPHRIENQSQLRSAINAAVRANMAIYTLDIRGLQALVPGGEAQNASLRGTSPYSGKSVASAFDSNATTQETLVTLAGDTGGRAFLDSNDFGRVFTGVQQDTSVYYLLGYHSTNPARDGRFRRITVRVNRPGVKLDFRRGYYAPADFQHSTRDDRERQLDEELASDLPTTDLPVYLVGRLFPHRGPQVLCAGVGGRARFADSFTRNNDQDSATLDVLGIVTDPEKRPVGRFGTRSSWR